MTETTTIGVTTEPAAQPVQRRRGRPKLDHPKVQISIRLDPDVADFFMRSGDGWTLNIGDVLRAHVRRQQRQTKRRRKTSRKAAR